MSRNNRAKNSLPNGSQENPAIYKNRIKELESEVGTLKSRLDELRKAKNNTILKREREVIHVGEPSLGRPVGVETSKYRELEKKYAELELKLASAKKETVEAREETKKAEEDKSSAEKERDEWKKKYENLEKTFGEMKSNYEIRLNETEAELREKSAQVDDMSTELERLRERLEVKAMQEEHKGRENSDREGHISKLTNENAYLREKVETLYMELSIKEAEWSEKEERFKVDLKKEWGERYGAWMAATEKKLAELHEANQMLKSCLYKGERKHKDDLKGFDEEDEKGEGSGSAT